MVPVCADPPAVDGVCSRAGACRERGGRGRRKYAHGAQATLTLLHVASNFANGESLN
jgi:hypothetical protein